MENPTFGTCTKVRKSRNAGDGSGLGWAFGKGHEVVATIEAFHAKIVLLRAAIELVSLAGSSILTFEVVKRSKEMLSLVPGCPSNY